jgi:hypothetical protein
MHVIAVWLQDPRAGLGDLIRGTMHLYDLSQELQFKLTVDMQFHPVSKYFALCGGEHSDYVLQNKGNVHNFINGDLTNLRHVIQAEIGSGRTEPLLVSSIAVAKQLLGWQYGGEVAGSNIEWSNITNRMNVVPTQHSAQFIRSALMPNAEFKTAFNAMCKLHNINCANKNHTIIHFRVGDDDLVNRNITISKYQECLRVLDTHRVSGLMDDTSYIISDSHWFKHFLRKVRPHLASRVLDTKPIHLTHSCVAGGSHDEMIADTMFDFYLLMTAKVIKTYSSYVWVSGFVRWVSHAFNVPVVNLNYEDECNQMNLVDSRLQSATATATATAKIRPSPIPIRTTDVITTFARTTKTTLNPTPTPIRTINTLTMTMTNANTTSARAFIPLRLFN